MVKAVNQVNSYLKRKHKNNLINFTANESDSLIPLKMLSQNLILGYFSTILLEINQKISI